MENINAIITIPSQGSWIVMPTRRECTDAVAPMTFATYFPGTHAWSPPI